MFRSTCALMIRTFDVYYADGTSALIRADVRVAARLLNSGDAVRIHVRGY